MAGYLCAMLRVVCSLLFVRGRIPRPVVGGYGKPGGPRLCDAAMEWQPFDPTRWDRVFAWLLGECGSLVPAPVPGAGQPAKCGAALRFRDQRSRRE